jgi:hypothetical protein
MHIYLSAKESVDSEIEGVFPISGEVFIVGEEEHMRGVSDVSSELPSHSKVSRATKFVSTLFPLRDIE